VSEFEPHLISAIICVFNDWDPLEDCLKSFALQEGSPGFEVVVVDDGSLLTLPDSIKYHQYPYRIRFVRQNHCGLSTARNTGIRAAIGSIFLFTDADCILDRNCLYNLSQEIAKHHDANCFQLCLTGEDSHLIGRAEQLHLSTIQMHKLLPTGHIRYLNTAGAAIRRRSTPPGGQVFDARALRAQDTLLLSYIISSGELPRFVNSATISHNVRLTVPRYLWKGLWTGYVEGRTYGIIRTIGVSVRSTAPERFGMLLSMWNNCLSHAWGVFPLVIVLARQSLSFLGCLSYRCFGRISAWASFRSGVSQTDN
jgi:glycosyltransferase involved in cell wall biosynthesis